MKKTAALCGVILGVSLLGSTVLAETVTTSMNFRSEPFAAGSLIGSVPKGSTVTVLGSQNGWDRVTFNGVTGWIHGGNLSNQPAEQPAAANPSAVITASAGASTSAGESVKVRAGMNFRATPGMDGRIMDGIPAGTTIKYLGSSNGWDKVVFNGVTGWIASGYTTPVSTSTTAAASSAASASTGAAASAGQYVKVRAGMNFRATPGMDGRIMDGIPAGTKVQYLGSSNGWDKVVFNGVTGWIASGYTTAADRTAQAAPAAAEKPFTVSSEAGTVMTVINTMNFRRTGNLDGALIGLIPNGSQVTYVSSADGWVQVIYNGMAGWIKGGNLR